MGRPKPERERPNATAADVDVELLQRRFRHITTRLGVLTGDPRGTFAELRPAVERMRAAAALEPDPAERLRLAIECAERIRPAALAILGQQGADFALPAGLLTDFTQFRPRPD